MCLQAAETATKADCCPRSTGGWAKGIRQPAPWAKDGSRGRLQRQSDRLDFGHESAVVVGPEGGDHAEHGIAEPRTFRISLRSGAWVVVYGWRSMQTSLYERLYHQKIATLTGRIRNGVGHTDSKNTPFQSLAADGAKLALWNLLYQDYDVYGFVHDEILVSISAATADEEAGRIEQIMLDSMAMVLGGIPTECKWVVSDYWAKPGLTKRKATVANGQIDSDCPARAM